MLDPLPTYEAEYRVRGCQSGFSVFIIINRARFFVSQSLLNLIGEVNKHYGNSTFQFWKRAA
jgi:hypothetical protein